MSCGRRNLTRISELTTLTSSIPLALSVIMFADSNSPATRSRLPRPMQLERAGDFRKDRPSLLCGKLARSFTQGLRICVAPHSMLTPLSRSNCCFGGVCTHAKCGRRLWLLSATLRPQEKREDNERKREQSRKQIHILIGQSLCLLGYGRAHWPVVCKCCLMDKTLCLHKIDQSGNGQGGDRRTRDTQERIGSW